MDLAAFSNIQFVFFLLVAFQLKHLAGDFLLQNGWMVDGKSRRGPGFVFPLTVHVLVHAIITLVIIVFVNPALWLLALVDFVAHFGMDRIKASPLMLGRFSDTNKQSFWIPFGVDQMVHHLTHYFIIWQLVVHR